MFPSKSRTRLKLATRWNYAGICARVNLVCNSPREVCLSKIKYTSYRTQTTLGDFPSLKVRKHFSSNTFLHEILKLKNLPYLVFGNIGKIQRNPDEGVKLDIQSQSWARLSLGTMVEMEILYECLPLRTSSILCAKLYPHRYKQFYLMFTSPYYIEEEVLCCKFIVLMNSR